MMTMGVSPSLLLAGVLDVLLELLLRGALLELALDLVPGLLLGLLVRLDLLLELAELLLGHVVVLLHSLRREKGSISIREMVIRFVPRLTASCPLISSGVYCVRFRERDKVAFPFVSGNVANAIVQ